ncbi:MFS transporter, partial [Helicobacter pylori]
MRVFVCFLGVFVSNGLGRFCLVVFIPPLIFSWCFTPHQSFPLGIVVLMGYVFWSFFIQFLS